MDGPPAQEATQIQELIQALEELRRRVAALEQRSESAAPWAQPAMPEFPASAEAAPGDLSSGLVPALGRLLLGIAGAYLLRAITEAGLWPQTAGTAAGILYAGAWLAGILRSRSANRWLAPLQGITAAAILAPLVWEATLRFHTLTPPATAAILALFLAAGQMIAWRLDRALLAGILAAAGAVTAVALVAATRDPAPFALALLMAAAVAEYGAFSDRALAARWIIALPADFCAFLLVYLLARRQAIPAGYAPVPLAFALAIPWALAGIYLASVLARTLVHRLPISWFEIPQLVTVIVLAIAGTLRLLPGTKWAAAAIGSGCLAAAAGCYGAAFAGRARRSARNYHAYALFALVLALIGSGLLLAGLPLAAFWAALAILVTWRGERRRNLLRAHGGFYLIAAALAAGLFVARPPAAAACLIGAASAIAYATSVGLRGGRRLPWHERVPPAIAAAILCWSFVAFVTSSAAVLPLRAAAGSTLRTALISLVALALAWIGSHRNLRELIWLLYPWMAFGALKLLIEDFRQGQSATLFLSLLVYGATLIVLPRLLRRPMPARSDLS